ncbi:MAG: hypothetical protein V9F03_11480 [Microthrixaceae bacterium]
MEGLYAELDAGPTQLGPTERPGQQLFAYIAMASRKDPGNERLSPTGQTNMQIMTLAPRGLDWWGVETAPGDGGRYRRNPTYRKRKEDLTNALLDAAQRVLGDQLNGESIRDHIVHLETATPLSHERYTNATGGTSYGYLHSS